MHKYIISEFKKWIQGRFLWYYGFIFYNYLFYALSKLSKKYIFFLFKGIKNDNFITLSISKRISWLGTAEFNDKD